MKILDLSKPLFDHMPVFPGDPDFILTQIQTIEKDGWNMKRIEMNLHDGTHVNVPVHMYKKGQTLSDIPLDRFWGTTSLYKPDMKIDSDIGLIFANHNIDMDLARLLVQSPPKFIGLSEQFEFDVPVEKYLLENNIISYEHLTNTEKLPHIFTFYGFPLNIREGDGSPVRAVAMI